MRQPWFTQYGCERQRDPHSIRCYGPEGFLCEQCGIFYPKDSETYQRYGLPWTIEVALGKVKPKGIRETKRIKRLVESMNIVPKRQNRKQRENRLNEALRFIAVRGLTPDVYG